MASTTGPIIPESYIDAPAQRLYILSLGLLCQAIKTFDFSRYLLAASDSTSFVRKWIVADVVYIIGLAQLRIPRLSYSKSAVALQLCLASVLNGLLFGGLVVDVGLSPFHHGGSSDGSSSAPRTIPALSNVLSSVGLGALVSASSSSNLLGQHTVRMSPVSTAELNADGYRFCLSPHNSPLLIPVLLNNTNPTVLRYSLTPLDGSDDKIEYFDVNPREMRLADSSMSHEQHSGAVTSPPSEEDEYDDDDAAEEKGPALQKTQAVAHIPVTRPGILRLERVTHSNSVDARLAYPTSLVIAPCPSAAFMSDQHSVYSFTRCSGSNEDAHTNIEISGVPPLSLQYSKHHKYTVEHFDVEGIDGNHHVRHRSNTPQTIQIPLDLITGAAGTHIYVLDSVTDGLGNQVFLGDSTSALIKREAEHPGSIAAEKSTYARSIHVLSRPQLAFDRCSSSNPAQLLKGQEVALALLASNVDPQDWPLEAIVTYEPIVVNDGKDNHDKASTTADQGWTRTLQIDGKNSRIQAGSPGVYILRSAHGKNCEAEILNPDRCPIVELTRPSADIEWSRIHECSGDTGVSVTMTLHGTPPFQVHYRTQRDNEHPREEVKNIFGSRGELDLKPDRSGHYYYTFVALSDANYKKVPLSGPSIEQSVHPLASVDFSHREQGSGRKQINSCAGSIVDVEIDLKGNGPWNIEVQTVDASESKTMSFTGITSSHMTLEIPLPKRIDKDGGIFTVDLVSVEDANGCKRTVSVPGIAINVRRIKPTVRFYGKPEQRRISVLQDARTELPLRLTGESPWMVKYRRAENPYRTESARVTSPNGYLSVQGRGTYELISVTDSQCPGTVSAENTFAVTWVDRPFAKLASETQVALDPLSGNYILPAVCENVDDHVDLELTGRAPFQLVYNIARDDMAGGTELIDQTAFSSIQSRTRFQLHTTEAGKKYYEVKQIGDASYPIVKNEQTMIPRAERLLFSQEVLRRPVAAFKQRSRLSYCYGDSFTSKSASDGVVAFLGTPPFEVRVSVKDLAVGETYEEKITVSDTTWAFALPSYTFTSVGPHLVTIESVQDASHCEQAVLDSFRSTMWVDVAETAAIVPYERREHFCVGDASQFQLEGTPPWSIGYSVNGKTHTKQSNQSPFTLVQQQSGEFAIHSIAHQQKMCTTTIPDLRWVVHPLPSATVGHGKKIIQDIYEGDQAEILFTLTGEPPFTFTYQRSKLAKKGKSGKVLETHTVTGVMKKEYSIFSALEGTWTVTFISDRYCRYPPIQTSSS